MTKKSFDKVSNPALQFMTAPEENAKEEKAAVEFKGLKRGRKPSKGETKSKRLNLLMPPSVYVDIGKIAAMKRNSTNELINVILQDYIENNKDLIKKYNEVFGDSIKE